MPVQRLTKKHLVELIRLLTSGEFKRADGRNVRKWTGRTVNLMLFTLDKVLEDAHK
jgi:hypothetical protein